MRAALQLTANWLLKRLLQTSGPKGPLAVLGRGFPSANRRNVTNESSLDVVK